MNYNIFKLIDITFKEFLLIFILSILIVRSVSSDSKVDLDYKYKNKFNEELLKGVLRGAGFNFKDSLLATESFKQAYPPERLTESSYLILPFIDKRMNTFAVSIDGKEAVLITKKNNKFKTFITSSKYAHNFVEKGLDDVIDNINLLEIETPIQEEIKTNANFFDEEIIFEKGDTLLNFLYVPGSKRKEISSAIKSFSVYFDPVKIKTKTKGKIVRTNEGKILGFYLIFSANKSILTYLSPAGYESVKVSTKVVDITLDKSINAYVIKHREFNSTRISLLNDPQLQKKKD